MKYFAKIYTPITRGKKALRTMGEGDEAILNLSVSFAQGLLGLGYLGHLEGCLCSASPQTQQGRIETKNPAVSGVHLTEALCGPKTIGAPLHTAFNTQRATIKSPRKTATGRPFQLCLREGTHLRKHAPRKQSNCHSSHDILRKELTKLQIGTQIHTYTLGDRQTWAQFWNLFQEVQIVAYNSHLSNKAKGEATILPMSKSQVFTSQLNCLFWMWMRPRSNWYPISRTVSSERSLKGWWLNKTKVLYTGLRIYHELNMNFKKHGRQRRVAGTSRFKSVLSRATFAIA